MQEITINSRLQFFLVGTEFFFTGGIQQVNRLLLRAFCDFAARYPATFHVFSYGDSAESLPAEWRGVESLRWHGCGRSRATLAATLAREAVRVRPDGMLLTHASLLPLVRPLRALSPRTRCGLLGHGVEVWSRLPRSGAAALGKLESVVAPSRFTAEQMARVNGMDPRRVLVIPHSLPPDWSVAPARPVKAQEPAVQLLTVSRLTPADVYKGVGLVIAAMPDVLRRYPHARLVIAGDGSDRQPLERVAQEAGVAQHVTFLGQVSNERLRELYAESDLFILPSKKEGFGLVFLEAMFHGTPVIAARAGGAVDVVEDGTSGVLVSGDDATELAQAVCNLLADPERRAAVGRNAQARVQERYLFSEFSRRWAAWLAAMCPQALYSAAQAAFLNANPAPDARRLEQ